MTAILLITFAILLLLDVPVAFCMILSSLAALLYLGIDPIMVGLETTRSLASFYAFLAVPFFILAVKNEIEMFSKIFALFIV